MNARRGIGSVLAPRSWRVASRLVVLVTIPAVLGLTLAGVLVARDAGSAAEYARLSQVAVLGQQVTGLTQALETERDAAARFVAAGRPAAGAAGVRQPYAGTDGWAGRVRQVAGQLDVARLPARTRASVATALGSLAELPGLRRSAARGPASLLQVTSGYSAAITGLFPVLDGIGDLSSDPVVISSGRALSSLSRLKDQAALQSSILNGVLTQGRFGPGMLSALTIARAQEASDLALFRASATPQETWALARTLAAPQVRQAQAVEQRAIGSGDGHALTLGPQAAAQWQAGTSYQVGWLRGAEQQLAGWITATARARQQSARWSAIVTGGVAVAGLILVLVLAVLIVRSVVRPLQRLEAETLDAAESRLPAEIRALTAEADSGHPAHPAHPDRPAYPRPALPVEAPAGDEIDQIARAVTRLRQEAVRLAGEEARLRDSVGVVLASYFRRSNALHDRLLGLIDNMELSEDDPERLAGLFQIDNLATRMGRHSDIALVLSGFETPTLWTGPVALVDLLRAASSEIEEYDRIVFDVQPNVAVSEYAAVDTVHLLAELLENATRFSPESAPVAASGYLVTGGGGSSGGARNGGARNGGARNGGARNGGARNGGVLIRITDAGPGLPEGQLRWLNWQLAHPARADERVADQMGVFAISHLAARRGISVELTLAPGGGTTAEVRLPADLIVPAAGPDDRRGGAGAIAADPQPFPYRITAGPQSPEGGWPERGLPEHGSPQRGLPEHGSPEDGVPEYGVPEDGVPERGLPEHGSPQPGSPERGLPEHGSPQRGSPERGLPEHGSPEYGVPEYGSPEHGVPEYGSPERGSSGDHSSALSDAADDSALGSEDRASDDCVSDQAAQAARARLAGFQQGSRRARAVAQLERDAT